jgi:uncharacterized protein YeeX (DUF496 family)
LLLKKRSTWNLLIIGSVLEYIFLTRAKAKWQVEGEKSTRYFCNLEKRHYLEKNIPNLILDNVIETSDQNQLPL